MITGAVHWRRGPSFRVRWGAFAMACAMAPLYFIGSLPLMGADPVRRRLRDRADDDRRDVADRGRPCPSGRLTEGMAIMQTGLVAGVAPGATLSGLVVDHQGASAAYLVSVGAGVVAAVAAQLLPRGT